MAVNIPGLVAVFMFYLFILGIGIWASRKSKREEKKCSGDKSEVAMVGGRNLQLLVGIFTTTATWVGGGFINVIAEAVYLPQLGLIWTQAPIGYSISLIVGGLVFVKPMRSKQYVTMLDPFQIYFGNTMSSLLLIPALFADIFWSAAILAALGATLSVILDIPIYVSIILSACVVILYTLLGGLYSVVYTDLIQTFFIVISLCCCVPFAIMNPAVADIKYTMLNELYQKPWLGKLEVNHIGRWIDDLLYLILGGIPWQVYFQRVLAASSVPQAQITSYVAGIFCFILALPSIIIGGVAVSTDWNQTSYGLPTPNERQESGMILPIVLQHLCPGYISILGIGAISAAVMSSADSSLLATSSMFSRNIYKKIIRKKAADNEVIWVMRMTIILFGAAATTLAILSQSIYGLYFLSVELIYAVLFPQLVCILFVPQTNAYGSAAGYIIGLTMRILAGESFLQIPPFIQYPGMFFKDGKYVQLFPFKTFTMLLSLLSIVIFSHLASFLFKNRLLEKKFDVFKITDKMPSSPEEQIVLHDKPGPEPDRKQLNAQDDSTEGLHSDNFIF
uniref:High-affinity choline transporter 1-like n=1 Tax=Callorhinchus milii TaxID=7868 RepID=A0A4W3IYU7_CALMI